MALAVLRYDLRAPSISNHEPGALYRLALEQVAWADGRGFDLVTLSEHHGVEDGYLPSPLVMAAAVAASTKRIRVNVAALLVPLHDPLRLAEDVAILDLVSGGRVSYVAGLGYRPEEYEQAGLSFADRGARMEFCLATLKQAWTGEPFDHEGRTVRVTPTPLTRPHPMLFYGGQSRAAARRAARFDLGFFPQLADEELATLYQEERARNGLAPGLVVLPPPGPGTIFCSTDPDRTWSRIGEHLLHDAREYASWQHGLDSAVKDGSTTVEQMREAGVYAVMTPDELIDHMKTLTPAQGITMHPLCGGLAEQDSWESLELIADEVLPAVRAGA